MTAGVSTALRAILCICLMLIFCKPAFAAEAANPGYRHPLSFVQAALLAYYRAHGEWPASWQAVVDAGLQQVPLRNKPGQLINPDSPELSQLSDVWYDAASSRDNRKPAAIWTLRKVGGEPELEELRPIASYRQVFIASSSQSNEDYRKFLTEDSLALMACASVIESAVLGFRIYHERYPSSLEELLDSPFTPITRNSINPATGERFRFDGSANDLLIDFLGVEKGVDVEPVGADGQPCRRFSPY